MRFALAAALLALPVTALAQEAAEPPTPASVVAASTPEEWIAIDPAELLVMNLAPDAAGKDRQVVIQLVPAPFSEGWVGNIRKLAQAHWWDGTSVYRVVDNWVAQWGDADETRALPDGVTDQPDDTYAVPRAIARNAALDAYLQPANDISRWASFHRGFPFAGTGGPDFAANWPIHCYGSVGVARSVGSGGTGSELYAVIGHAPRQLDRNIAVVGRVIEGIEHLSTLPRGTGDAGVYETDEEHTPIVSVRLGDELPEAERPRFEYLASDSESFARYLEVRANRNDPFYRVPAGGVDLCSVQVPIRRAAEE